jgi:hypothetical protein
MKAILQMQERIRMQGADARDRYAVMGMVDKDNNPDNERIASFNQGKADEALRKIGQAKTKEEAQQWYDRYMQYIDMVVQSGFAINNATGVNWAKWAGNQTWKGEDAIAAILDKLGLDTQNANDEFMQKWQPIIDRFTKAGDSIAKIPDDPGKGTRDFIDEIGGKGLPILKKFNDEIIGVTDRLDGLGESLDDILSRWGVPTGEQPIDGGHSRMYSAGQSAATNAASEVSMLAAEVSRLRQFIGYLVSEIRDLGGAAGDAAVRLDDVLANGGSNGMSDFGQTVSARRRTA